MVEEEGRTSGGRSLGRASVLTAKSLRGVEIAMTQEDRPSTNYRRPLSSVSASFLENYAFLKRFLARYFSSRQDIEDVATGSLTWRYDDWRFRWRTAYKVSRPVNAKRICSTRTSPVPGLVLFIACLFPAQVPAFADEWHFSDVERIVAVGDVHGAYDALVATLQNAGVIDEDLKWSGGKTHLVSTGDLLDRGAHSRRVMDLMSR